MPDPSQPAPLNRLTDRQLGDALARVDAQATADRLAAHDLGMISELRGSKAFEWFLEKCLVDGYETARDEMLKAEDAELPKKRAAFFAIRDAANWLTRREIMRRKQANAQDSELGRLAQTLLP